MYSDAPPHMAEQKQEDQREHTYSSYVRIQDVTLKTCRRQWTIGRSGERGSGISVLAARHDDDAVVSLSRFSTSSILKSPMKLQFSKQDNVARYSVWWVWRLWGALSVMILIGWVGISQPSSNSGRSCLGKTNSFLLPHVLKILRVLKALVR